MVGLSESRDVDLKEMAILRLVEHCGRVQTNEERNAFVAFPSPSKLHDGNGTFEKSSYRKSAQPTEHLWCNYGKLLFQVGLAVKDFIGKWIPVVRWTTFQNVADVDLFAGNAVFSKFLGQEVPRSADKGYALGIFVCPRRFTNKDKIRIGVADTKYRICACMADLAPAARRNLL